MNTNQAFFLVVGGLFVGVLLLAGSSLLKAKPPLGSAGPGLASTVATSSQATVSSTVAGVAATSTNCASRVIGTQGTAIMLTFRDQDTASASVGFPQAASTTITYDCALFGNGKIKVYSFGSATINVMETR